LEILVSYIRPPRNFNKKIKKLALSATTHFHGNVKVSVGLLHAYNLPVFSRKTFLCKIEILTINTNLLNINSLYSKKEINCSERKHLLFCLKFERNQIQSSQFIIILKIIATYTFLCMTIIL
jgi:hypothetical protein